MAFNGMLPCLIKVCNFIIDLIVYKDITLVSLGIQVSGTVPGSIYTDLDKADKFTGGPLLFRFNDLEYRWVSYENWDYSLTFSGLMFHSYFKHGIHSLFLITVPANVSSYSAVDLVFHGYIYSHHFTKLLM